MVENIEVSSLSSFPMVPPPLCAHWLFPFMKSTWSNMVNPHPFMYPSLLHLKKGVYFIHTSYADPGEKVLWDIYNTIREVESTLENPQSL
jgi:hypothetical protein